MRSLTGTAAALGGAILGALVATATPAAADWQYTRWGMTAGAVVSASDSVARTNDDRSLDAEGVRAALVAPFQGASLPFTAVFLFDREDRLRYVTLNPLGKIACPVIAAVLATHYGAPEGRADLVNATTMRWDDLGDDNLVVYLDLGRGDCSIQYSKLPSTRPNGKGL